MTGKPKREKRLEIRFNEVEYEALKAYAAKKGVSLAEAVRDLVKSVAPV